MRSHFTATRDSDSGYGGEGIVVKVKVDSSDIFNRKQRDILDYIIQNTPKKVVETLAKDYNVTTTRIVTEIAKIRRKINECN